MYTPILKAKQGEFQAWAHVDPVTRQRLSPVFEYIEGTDEDTEKNVRIFVGKVLDASSAGDVVSIDLADDSGESAVRINGVGAYKWAANELKTQGIILRPVIRATDGADVWEDAASAAALTGHGVLLRVGGVDNEIDPEATASDIRAFADNFEGSWPGTELHLLLDFFRFSPLRLLPEQGR